MGNSTGEWHRGFWIPTFVGMTVGKEGIVWVLGRAGGGLTGGWGVCNGSYMG